MKYAILAAGRGTRNTDVDGLHKALLPLENKPIISHIIDRLDDKYEIVIAVGYKSNQIKTYLDAMYHHKKITYVDVDNFDKKGSGPGYSLMCCKSELQEPFVFTSVDTLVTDDIDFMDIGENWLGTSKVEVQDSLNYCLVNGSKYLDNLYYGSGDKAYIGMAGIHEYDKFWNALEEHKIIKDEYQVIHGFDGLDRIKLIDFVWFDTGNNEAYFETKKAFGKEIVANKNDEAIFIHENKVVKYFNDPIKIEQRIERTKYLNGNCPEVTALNENMYSYDFLEGKLLANTQDELLLRKFLDHCQDNLFITQERTKTFDDDCCYMYETKTKERLESLAGSGLDKINTVNGIKVYPIEKMLDQIDWKQIYKNSIPSYFHGDLQPENILIDQNKEKFILIDWRQKFGNSLKVGDVYYDLGKLYHGLLINGTCILEDMFDYSVVDDAAYLDFYAKSNLVCFLEIFEKFCIENNYSWNNVRLLGIIQYLNICSLYDNFKDGKYGDFLFLYGKYSLAKFFISNQRT